MPSSLSHLRVLDLSRVLAGPWCSQHLADLGAEVIKIERPGTGDETRAWGPPFLKDIDGNDTTEAGYYLSCNRGKKSLTLDIATKEGQDIVRKLAAKSDVVLENFKVGQLKKYGLGYDDLAAINHKLVYCSITGFGQTGPWSHRPGYDFIIQGLGGLMSITGERDDAAGGGPQKVGVAVTDLMTGMYSTIAILAALAHRERSGAGQYIDMALLDVSVAMLANMNMNYLTSGQAPKRWGNAHPNVVPYQVFACSDGHIIVAVGNDGQFRKFCEVLGASTLGRDERFATNSNRIRNRAALITLLEPPIKLRTRDEWVDALEAAGIPCGPINTIAQVFENPQVKARGVQLEIPHPLAGSVPQVANPMRFSETPIEYHAAPPTLGQHNEYVLRELLGMGSDDIEKLSRKNVI
ncbi:MAG: CaiB/BaiF CoA-transferase family protein [Burkholderiales bacterium]|nr:CoA transferase [Pseudomonadota bacterium]